MVLTFIWEYISSKVPLYSLTLLIQQAGPPILVPSQDEPWVSQQFFCFFYSGLQPIYTFQLALTACLWTFDRLLAHKTCHVGLHGVGFECRHSRLSRFCPHFCSNSAAYGKLDKNKAYWCSANRCWFENLLQCVSSKSEKKRNTLDLWCQMNIWKCSDSAV